MPPRCSPLHRAQSARGLAPPATAEEEASQLAAALAASLAEQEEPPPEPAAAGAQAEPEAADEEELAGSLAALSLGGAGGAAEAVPASCCAAEAPEEEPAASRRSDTKEAPEPLPEPAVEERSGRCYAIWRVPGAAWIRGIHTGGVGTWWTRIVPALPGQQYRYRDGTRLRGYESFEAAHAGYLLEADRHAAPVPPPVNPLPPA